MKSSKRKISRRKIHRKRKSRTYKKRKSQQRGGAGTLENPNLYSGMVNNGNSCYYNSALQMIYHIPELRGIILKLNIQDVPGEDNIIKAIIILFKNYAVSKGTCDKLNKDYITALGNAVMDGSTFDQKDSPEFIMNTITNRILYSFKDQKGEMKKQPCPDDIYCFPDSISDLFRINEETVTYCQNHTIRQEEQRINPAATIQIPITTGLVSIQNGLDLLNTNEVVQLERCDSNNAIKEIKYKIFPKTKYLIITLSRFIFNEKGEKRKIQGPIISKDIIRLDDTFYSLRGFIYHDGGINGGHYVYYWKNPSNDWYLFDDTRVNKISISDHIKNTGYCYLYEKYLLPNNPSNAAAAAAAGPATTRVPTANLLGLYSSPAAPVYSARAPTTPANSARAPTTPAHSARAPTTPAHPARAPTTPAHSPRAPTTPADSARAPAVPSAPTNSNFFKKPAPKNNWWKVAPPPSASAPPSKTKLPPSWVSFNGLPALALPSARTNSNFFKNPASKNNWWKIAPPPAASAPPSWVSFNSPPSPTGNNNLLKFPKGNTNRTPKDPFKGL